MKIIFALVIFSAYFNVAHAGLILGAPKYVGLSQGLVGFWSFNGPDMNATQALDASGNANHGTLTNGPKVIKGKLGQALSFDGSNDFVHTTNTPSNKQEGAWAAWVYLNTISGTQTVIMDGTTWPEGFQITSTGAIKGCIDGSCGLDTTNTSTFLSAGRWYYIVLTMSPAGGNSHIYINGALNLTSGRGAFDVDCAYTIGASRTCDGVTTSNFLNGFIDDVRVYNRALTADEIKRLYKIGATTKIGVSLNTGSIKDGLVGYWSFNGPDMNATKALDSSGQGNHGTLTNMDVKKSTVAGKLGQALNFDGSDDSVVIGSAGTFSSLTSFSISAWVYNNKAPTNSGDIFSTLTGDSGGNTPSEGFMLGLNQYNGDRKLRLMIDHSTTDVVARSASTLPTNQMTHVVVTWNGGLAAASSITFYINGVNVGSESISDGAGSYVTNTTAPKIGRSPTNTFSGTIDDVRIYNRALSADEIKRLYNLGR